MLTHKKHQEKLIIVAIALGVILNPLNTTMITVALPSIQQDFDLSSTDISWLIASYFIISAICTPLIGKFSDMYGRKSIFLFGYFFTVSSTFYEYAHVTRHAWHSSCWYISTLSNMDWHRSYIYST